MDFTDVLRKYSIPFINGDHRNGRPGWINFDCPWCGKSRPYYMGYNLAGRYVHCWACGSHSLLQTLCQLTGEPWGSLKALVGDLPKSRKQHARTPGRLVLPKGVGPLLRCHKEYLRGRGFDTRVLCQTWGIQGIGLAAHLPWRIFIPITFGGELVSWTTRSLVDHGTRYISAKASEESYPHKELLYGEELASHTIIINEGPLDVWAWGPGAVGTCGTGYSRAQVLRMSRFLRRVVCFDNETMAQRRARKLCDELEVFAGETYNVVLDSKDAGSSDPRQLAQLRRKFLDS